MHPLSALKSAALLAFLCLGSASPTPEIRRGLPPKTVALTYHDIVPRRDSSALWFDCTPGELRAQIEWMKKRGAHFVSVPQLYEHLTRGSALPPHPVVVTFADNYESFIERALPILREYRVPVAQFVHTGWVGDHSHGRPKMSWDELRRVDRDPLVTIGSQTVSHAADIRKLSASALRREMTQSKADLEAHLGHRIRFLAYPNGKYDARCERAARDAGYIMAFSEEQRPSEKSDSIYSVDRYVHTKYRKAWGDASR
jgi:peptidoglycan/xylan/chitin deacetylase (PgdA/CDA1 family)